MRIVVLLLVIFQSGLVLSSCATTTTRPTPPENYQGPIASEPVIRPGDYWIYERGDSTRSKSTRMLSNLQFPLWIGKTWRYDTAARRPNQPPNTPAEIPAWIDCSVAAVNDVSVPAGSFRAFQCECQCLIVGGERFYQEGCGAWTAWYAPEAKNIVKMKGERPTNSFELLEYKVSGGAKVVRTIPDDGSENVPTSLKEIVIVFDQPMSRAWNINCSPAFFPDAPAGRTCTHGGTHWENERTFVVQLTTGLKPNQLYSFGVNPSVSREQYDPKRTFHGFTDSTPVVSQRFSFTTQP
jgi:hypothetical protein